MVSLLFPQVAQGGNFRKSNGFPVVFPGSQPSAKTKEKPMAFLLSPQGGSAKT